VIDRLPHRIVHRTPAWLDRFCEPRLIRRRGILDHVACRDVDTGNRLLVIASTAAGAGRVLDDIAQRHSELDHPHIPKLDQRSAVSGTELVVLRSSAVADVDTLLPIAMSAGGLSPGASIAFLYAVIDAIRAAHATGDPPICIGAFSGTNLIITEEHHVHVIGWGYPTAETERRVVLRDPTVMHVAWEASFGARVTPNSDLDAVGRFFHALLPATAMPPVVIAALRGDETEQRTMDLVRLIESLERAAHARDPERRSWDSYLDSLQRILALLEVVPDADALRRELAAVCIRWRTASHLRAARDGSWFTLQSGERVELDRRQNLRRIVAVLVASWRDAAGEPVPTATLLAAGWPGERVGADSGRNRVRVAVSTLRSMGLRDVLLSRDDGYLLDPDVALSIE
jgi:hypothetical protein